MNPAVLRSAAFGFAAVLLCAAAYAFGAEGRVELTILYAAAAFGAGGAAWLL